MQDPYPYSHSRPQNSTLAIISLVAGILGLTFLPGLASIIAIITGYMAQKEIQESGGRLEGENLARIGLILGWISVALGVLVVACVLIFVLGMMLWFPASVEFSLLPALVFGLV